MSEYLYLPVRRSTSTLGYAGANESSTVGSRSQPTGRSGARFGSDVSCRRWD